ALTIIPELCRQGIKIKAYDPEAMPEAARHFKDRMNMISLCSSMDESLSDSDCLLILTEWECFRNADLSHAAGLLRHRILFDFRNLHDKKSAAGAGLDYYGIGR
ncbi:MAG: UDP-glucose 6-dehydrogenase, partial [Clostridia bacterium]|nr:UDP-glucose 6-dehydrogenase [Clostridia bacterium]